MLGTADELALEPEKKTVFMEDLSEAELNTKVGPKIDSKSVILI